MTPPRGPQPPLITLAPAERQALETLLRQHSAPQQLVLRARIVLAGAQGLNNAQIARELGVSIDAARLWSSLARTRPRRPGGTGGRCRPAARFAAARRPGSLYRRAVLPTDGHGNSPDPGGFRATDQPLDPAGDRRRSPAAGNRRPHFAAPRGAAVKKGDSKPHQIRYWLTPPPTEPAEERNEKIADICTLYQEAPARAATGERILSSDEMTGVQALERNIPGTAPAAGEGRSARIR